MTKPISEPTPALEAANYGWRIRQLERRPGPRRSWCQVGFTSTYTFAAGTYNPLSKWGTAIFAYFITNDLFTYQVNFTNNLVVARPGIYHGNLKALTSINGQFLDLPPQAGTTRIHKGALQTQYILNFSTSTLDLMQTHDWTQFAYDLSQGSTLGLGVWRMEVAGFCATTTAANVFPQFLAYDALIGPNNTGTFPEFAPSIGGTMWLERIGDYGSEDIDFP